MSKINYSDFEYGKLNRRISETNLADKKVSITKFGLLSRITVTIVNGKYFIIDGQHRFRAMMELGLPITTDNINVITVKDEEELIKLMVEMNSELDTWRKMNFVELYASAGNKTYQNILDFMLTYHVFGITAFTTILSIGNKGGKNTRHYLQSGKFEVGSWTLSKRFAEQLVQIGQYTDYYKHFQFVMAFGKVSQNPDYKQDIFLAQLKKGKHLDKKDKDIFEGVANVSKFKELIIDIYNDRLRDDKIRIY